VKPIIAAAMAAALFAAAPLGAHETADWIRLGNYRGSDNLLCCGADDCAVVAPGEIRRLPDAWLHVPTGTTLHDSQPGAYASRDEKMWRCVRGGRLRCVFTGAGT